MRYLLKFKSPEKLSLYCIVVKASSSKEALNQAVAGSKGLNMNFQLSVSTPYLIENWEAPTIPRTTQGDAKYTYKIVYANKSVQGGHTDGQGVKTAFNRLSQGVKQPISVVFLYDNTEKAVVKKEKTKSTSEAKVVLQKKSETVNLFQRATTKMQQLPDGDIIRELGVLMDMVYDYMTGRYKNLPIQSLIGITAAIVYFVSPVDFIPDFIPFVGQVDDIGVICFALKAVHKDMEAYLVWKNTQVKA